MELSEQGDAGDISVNVTVIPYTRQIDNILLEMEECLFMHAHQSTL